MRKQRLLLRMFAVGFTVATVAAAWTMSSASVARADVTPRARMASSPQAGSVVRVSGADRFGTAAQVSASQFAPGVPVVYVADGLNFPDALAAGPVAAAEGGPVLLVAPTTVPSVTAAELTRLQPKKIVILGGTGAVSATVATALQKYTTGSVVRVSGADRFGTAAQVSASQFAPGVPVVYVADGLNFPDALAAGPVAAAEGGPVLLVAPTTVPSVTAAELTRLQPKKIVILGGTGAVSATVATALQEIVTPFVSVTASFGTAYALKSDGTVWGWGVAVQGAPVSSSPARVGGLSGITAIVDAGLDTIYALKNDGTVWAWGSNENGQLGNGSTVDGSDVPVRVSGLTGITSVEVGGQGTAYALKSDGTVWAWGYNADGALGNGTTTTSRAPVRVGALTGVASVVPCLNEDCAFAVKTDGTAWAWGANDHGELGDGTTTSALAPVQIAGLTDVKGVSPVWMAGGNIYETVYAIKDDGTVWGWGYAADNGADTMTPVQIDALAGATSFASGYGRSAYAVMSDGSVNQWGPFFGPMTKVSGLTGVRTITTSLEAFMDYYAGVDSLNGAYAVKTDGTVWGWGDNTAGALGNGTTVDSTVPVQAHGLTDIVSLVSGTNPYALKSDGTIWSWGYGAYGTLGNGTTTNSSVPVQVIG